MAWEDYLLPVLVDLADGKTVPFEGGGDEVRQDVRDVVAAALAGFVLGAVTVALLLDHLAAQVMVCP